jgi:uncharacterized SAM-binding protein YcdF (DUF218 family)
MKLKKQYCKFFPEFFHSRKILNLLKKFTFGLFFVLGIWLLVTTITLVYVSSKPVDGFVVLGGSIRREIHVAKLVKEYPHIPTLISKGSKDACVWRIFAREAAPMENIWLENCANSTFDNFYYSIPTLRSWGVHKVKLITSPSHLPRSLWMGRIILGSHGIWVEPEIVTETGRPGNHENWLKTGFDVSRSILWAGLSQGIQTQCSQINNLARVNMNSWKQQGYKCERQGNL